MNEKLLEFKKTILASGLFKRKNHGWYQGKECPYCGDRKNHYHIRIVFEDDSSVRQNCFKCNVHGVVDDRFLECYGIEWNGYIPKGKLSRKIVDGNVDLKNYDIINYDTNPEYIERCMGYIKERVGVYPSKDDLRVFNIVGDPKMYATLFLNGEIHEPEKKCWFLCSNGMLAGRDVVKKKDGWEKFVGSTKLTGHAVYTTKNDFNTHEIINVCICEGIMDAIGLYYNGNIDNGLFIAVLGRDYMSGVRHVLNNGIYGDSVCIRIYKDSDVDNVRIDRSLCQFFKSVNVYMNSIGKDFGVKPDEIDIVRIM